MELRMKEPHEKGVAIRSAPSFALGAEKCPVKRKQGKRWAGYRASKICNQGADAVPRMVKKPELTENTRYRKPPASIVNLDVNSQVPWPCNVALPLPGAR